MRPELLAYYYPGWTRTRSFDEWDIVASGRSAFSEHRQPRVPVRKYYVEDADVVRWQIESALSAGVRGFVFCWYWDNGRIHMPAALENFVNVVDEFPDFRFAVMWTNRAPHSSLPIASAQLDGNFYRAFSERIVETSPSDIADMVSFCWRNLFSAKAYLRVGRQPLFVVFSVRDLWASLGQPPSLEAGVLSCLFAGTHLVGVAHGLEYWLEDAKRLGFTGLTSYVLLPDWHGPGIQDYARYARRARLMWGVVERLSGLPYMPAVTTGWDASCRGKEPVGQGRKTYPWYPIITGDSPGEFERHLAEGIRHAEDRDVPYVMVASWNEWSEGHYLEPDLERGDSMLRALKRAQAGRRQEGDGAV